MKILILLAITWLVGVFLGSTYEGPTVAGSWAGTGDAGYVAGETPSTTLQYLFNVSNAVQSTSILGIIPFVKPNGDYFSAVYRVATLQFTFMHDYPMFYWFLLLPFAIWGILNLVLLFIATISGNITWD